MVGRSLGVALSIVRLPWSGRTTMATSASAEAARARAGRADAPTGLWQRARLANVSGRYGSATRDSHAAGPCALETDPAPGAKDHVIHHLYSQEPPGGRGTRPAFAQARHISLPERPGSAEGAKHLVRDQQGRTSRRPVGDQQREELVIRKRRRAARDETLSRTRGLGPLADGHAGVI